MPCIALHLCIRFSCAGTKSTRYVPDVANSHSTLSASHDVHSTVQRWSSSSALELASRQRKRGNRKATEGAEKPGVMDMHSLRPGVWYMYSLGMPLIIRCFAADFNIFTLLQDLHTSESFTLLFDRCGLQESLQKARNFQTAHSFVPKRVLQSSARIVARIFCKNCRESCRRHGVWVSTSAAQTFLFV